MIRLALLSSVCVLFMIVIELSGVNNDYVCFRDHAFDSENRGRRTHSRPSGLISEPSVPVHGERGVRQFHRRDHSKILAHRRLGFVDFPDL